MGVKKIMWFWAALGAWAVISIGPACASDAMLERQAWPDKRACDTCVPLQFGVLQLQLPLAQVGNILVLGSDGGGVNIFPKNGDPAESVLLGSIRRENLVGMFETSGLLNRTEGISN